MMKSKKKNNSMLLLLIFFLLIINYKYIVSEYFYYEGYDQSYFSIFKLIISLSLIGIFVFLYTHIKKDFYKIVYSIYLVLVYFGQSIFYIFNESNFILVIYMSIPLIMLFIQQKIDKERPNRDTKLKLSDNLTWFVFIILSLLVILPFLKNYHLINFKNLLLKDIYITRSLQIDQLPGIIEYLFSPISRVVLPFLFIYSLENKKWLISILSLISLLMMFLLNGAVKSIFFSLLACIFFYKGNYYMKERRFLKVMIGGTMLSIFELLIMGSYFIGDYLRRIFFLPAILFEVYYKYFKGQPTLFLHSRISKILRINQYPDSIPHFIGEYILGKKGLSANVGIFAEGFLSFGIIGVIISSIIFSYIIRYINKRKLDPTYFGILFSYIYVINTSFLETLLITHGLLFYLVFALFVIPKRTLD